ncbi:MAG: hypothetical protein RIR26_1470 [Pseudomonadota bacterium]|jgi:ribosomal protein L15
MAEKVMSEESAVAGEAVGAAAKAEELRRTLNELKAWALERQKALRDINNFIQNSLASGKLTEKKDMNSKQNYLSKRMIATLELDSSQIKRSLCFMRIRKRELEKELHDCEELSRSDSKSA